MSDADHWVYTCRDATGVVLYVGITSQGLERFRRGHSRRAGWWPDVQSVEIAHFDTRAASLANERLLIDTLKPLHNIAAVELEGDIPDRDTLPTNWLKIGQIAGWLDASIEEVVVWMEHGMPHIRLGSTPRFRAAEVREWLARQ